MKKVLETAIVMVCTLCWWGYIYPELCLTPEPACVGEADAQTEAVEAGAQAEAAEADAQTVCIKSRFVEYVYEIRENILTEKRKSDDK